MIGHAPSAVPSVEMGNGCKPCRPVCRCEDPLARTNAFRVVPGVQPVHPAVIGSTVEGAAKQDRPARSIGCSFTRMCWDEP